MTRISTKSTTRRSTATSSASATSIKPSSVERSQAAALDKEICEIRGLLASAREKTSASLYVVAKKVLLIKTGERTYGAGAVKSLEEALDVSSKSLYRWATVAEAWPTAGDFEGVCSQRNSKGLPLSWSHLERLAEIENTTERFTMMKRALDESLSVRKLEAAIDEMSESNVKPRKGSASHSAPALPDLAEEVVDRLRTWQREIVELTKAPRTQEVLAALTSMRDSCESMLDALDEALDPVEAEVASRAQAASA